MVEPPIRKICQSKWESSAIFGVNMFKKCLSCHLLSHRIDNHEIIMNEQAVVELNSFSSFVACLRLCAKSTNMTNRHKSRFDSKRPDLTRKSLSYLHKKTTIKKHTVDERNPANLLIGSLSHLFTKVL